MSPYIIYGLACPSSGDIRYIGLSSIGSVRPKQHFTASSLKKNTNPHKNNWIRQVLSAGLKPEIKVLAECDRVEDLGSAEQFCIAYYKMLGADLTNLSSGGDLGPLGYKHTEEAKQKISEANKRRKVSEEAKRKMSDAKTKNSVLCVTTGQEFVSAKEAARALSVDSGSIYGVLKGKRKQTGGYVFRYL